MRCVLAICVAVIAAFAAVAKTPPLEAFAALDAVSDAALSPDGKRVAMIMRRDDGQALSAVFDLETRQYVGQALAVDDIKPRAIGWGDNNYVLLWASDTKRLREFRESKMEFRAVFAYDWRKPKPQQLLVKAKDIVVSESLGRVVSGTAKLGTILMAAHATEKSNYVASNRAYGDTSSGRVYSVFEAPMDNGRGRPIHRGSPHTMKFLADENGRLFARVDHDDVHGVFTIFAFDARERQKVIFQRKDAKQFPFDVWGLTPDKTALVISGNLSDDSVGIYHLALTDGEISGPFFSREHAHMDSILVNERSDVVVGFAFTDIDGGDYEFYDPALTEMTDWLSESLSSAAVRPVSWTADLDAWLFHAEGGITAGAYVFHRRSTDETYILTETRSAITREHIAPVMTIEYKARDGLKIPGLLTVPPTGPQKNRPTIVLPHGGPESHDSYGWHWMAQYFANQGYAVLQPNFRGSDGFGSAFLRAGWGEWGRAMQDDVTDGLKAMIQSGYTDPDRVCIVGWSYGGYSALAGAVFTPDLYRCVVAIAPVTDLQSHLAYLKNRYGDRSGLVYHELLELQGPDGDADLRAASPIHFAENVRAPVLLIHGRDDTVVEVSHSTRMDRALRRAGKDVTFVQLKNQDHSLLRPETRVEAMQAMEAFVRAHLGG